VCKYLGDKVEYVPEKISAGAGQDGLRREFYRGKPRGGRNVFVSKGVLALWRVGGGQAGTPKFGTSQEVMDGVFSALVPMGRRISVTGDKQMSLANHV